MSSKDYDEDNYIDFSININVFNWIATIVSLLFAILFLIQGTDVEADPERELLEGSRYMFYFCVICMFYNIFKISKYSFRRLKRNFTKKSLLK